MPPTQDTWMELFQEITDAFSPGAPIQEKDLFAGRLFGYFRASFRGKNDRARRAPFKPASLSARWFLGHGLFLDITSSYPHNHLR